MLLQDTRIFRASSAATASSFAAHTHHKRRHQRTRFAWLFIASAFVVSTRGLDSATECVHPQRCRVVASSCFGSRFSAAVCESDAARSTWYGYVYAYLCAVFNIKYVISLHVPLSTNPYLVFVLRNNFIITVVSIRNL